MARASYSGLHPVDNILSNVLNEAIPSDMQLIAGQVFEPVQVTERSGTILSEESRSFMGEPGADSRRAPGASRQELSHFNRSSTTFRCEIHSFADSIAMEDIEDSQYPMSEEMRSARRVQRALLLAQEKRAADALFDTVNFTTDTPATKFDAAGGEPLSYIHEQMDVLRASNHGIMPDTMVLGYSVFRELARNPEVRSFVGNSSSGIASGLRILPNQDVIEVLKSVFQLQHVYVGEARRETAVAGATSSEAQIWEGETIGLYLMRGAMPEAKVSGNVKVMPVCGLDLRYKDYIAGQYDSLDRVRRHVYGEHVQQYKILDYTRGLLLTDTLT
jgi:hypothetical protein